MQIGTKAQGQDQYGKMCVRRHGSKFSKASAARCEKKYETKVRRAGKRACQRGAV